MIVLERFDWVEQEMRHQRPEVNPYSHGVEKYVPRLFFLQTQTQYDAPSPTLLEAPQDHRLVMRRL
jgi:hypothetical protein